MKQIALVDFDDTLVRTDSLVSILKAERLFFDVPLLYYGFFAALFAPIGGTLRHWARSEFKRRMLTRIKKLPYEILEKHVRKLRDQINFEVVTHVKNNSYDAVVIVSAGERHLIERTLSGILHCDKIIANDWDSLKDFKTCWGKEKAVRVKDMFRNEQCVYSLYTDSFHDRFLMEMCNAVYLVKDGKISIE